MTCYNEDILFIHIPKTGGHSCRAFLAASVPNLLMHTEERSKLPNGHMRLQDMEAHTGRTPDSFKKIVAVVRNPFAHQVSLAVFWATRFVAGVRTPFEIATWQHVHIAAVDKTLQELSDTDEAMTWGPEHLDMASFVSDMRCDVHAWSTDGAEEIETRWKPGESYADYGGFYRYWLTVDGEIPDNLTVVRAENLSDQLPSIVRDYCREDAVVPTWNVTSHRRDIPVFYTEASRQAVVRKFEWAFDNYYERNLWT